MDTLHQFKEDLKDKVEETTEQVKDKAQDVYESGKKQVHEAQKILQNNTEDLINKIKEKPIQSVLIAAGIGYLLSKFIK